MKRGGFPVSCLAPMSAPRFTCLAPTSRTCPDLRVWHRTLEMQSLEPHSSTVSPFRAWHRSHLAPTPRYPRPASTCLAPIVYLRGQPPTEPSSDAFTCVVRVSAPGFTCLAPNIGNAIAGTTQLYNQSALSFSTPMRSDARPVPRCVPGTDLSTAIYVPGTDRIPFGDNHLHVPGPTCWHRLHVPGTDVNWRVRNPGPLPNPGWTIR